MFFLKQFIHKPKPKTIRQRLTEFRQSFLPESDFDFLIDPLSSGGTMKEERIEEKAYQVIIPDVSEWMFVDVTSEAFSGNQKENEN